MSHLEYLISEFIKYNPEFRKVVWNGTLTIYFKGNNNPFCLNEFKGYTRTRLLLERLESDCIIAQLKDTVQNWLNKQGHDKCHYYPEIFKQIIKILDLSSQVNDNLPPEEEFKTGCENYRKELYYENNNHYSA